MNACRFASSLVLVPLFVVATGACGSKKPPSQPTDVSSAQAASKSAAASAEVHAKWTSVASTFLKRYLETYPVAATEAGNHEHDGAWPDFSALGEAKERALFDETEKAIAGLGDLKLDAQDALDRETLLEWVHSARFTTDVLKPAETDPLGYTGTLGSGFDALLSRNFGTPESRKKSLVSRLDGVKAVVDAAKARLKNPPKVHTETAIKQAEGLLGMVKTDAAKAIGGPDPALEKAQVALTDFIKFLKTDLLPRSNGNFRIGKESFDKKLSFYLGDNVSSDELVKDARALIEKTQDEMFETTKELWPELMKATPVPAGTTRPEKRVAIKKMLDKLAETRPTSATIVADATKLLEQTTAFVKEKDLVRVPTEPCRVIEMPEARRGVSIAYCDSSGPLEEKQETFYAIAPTPKDWPAARSLSFYKEYNQAMLADLTVHEAMPGHYLQAMHANVFKDDVRAVFASGPFVEGWAVYGEWLMAKHGYGGARVRMQRQKMMLRASANAILDAGIHAGNLEEKDALALMQGEAFQEEGEAVGKWKRARLTSAQLSTYFYGFREMMKLREDAVKQAGDKFSERAYHDKLLSQGAPTMKQTRALFEHASSPWGLPAVAAPAKL